MDPIKVLLEFLQDNLSQLGGQREVLEQRVREIFEKFELVPKQDYAAHLQLLHKLELQVSELEARLQTLEDVD